MGTDQHRDNGLWLCSGEVRPVSETAQILSGKNRPGRKQPACPCRPGYSSFLGVLLVGLGAIMGVLAFIRYKKVEKQIDQDAYQPSIMLDILLAISILTIGVFLVFILLHSM